MNQVVSDPIPWAAPLTQAMQALKRAEERFMLHDTEKALSELRLAEDNVRHCRYCVEAKR